jgi:hypothetical protein
VILSRKPCPADFIASVQELRVRVGGEKKERGTSDMCEVKKI